MVKIPSSVLRMLLMVFWDVLDIILKFVVVGNSSCIQLLQKTVASEESHLDAANV